AYLEKEGYPPLRINSIEKQQNNEISLPGNISSQYISALLMIAPCLPLGLTVSLTTEIFSRPYIQMTLDLMEVFGVTHEWDGNTITIPKQSYHSTSYTIESDWSGASYWYGFMTFANESSSLRLKGLKEKSTQGDQAIVSIMENLGIQTDFEAEGVNIRKSLEKEDFIKLDFRNCPDLAQTVMVAAAATNTQLEMTGLESLKIKETDRIKAMQNELHKIGARLEEHDNRWTLIPSSSLPSLVEIETYEDHRMAMAFAPLCQLMDAIIQDPVVVNKSYPSFWDHVRSVEVTIEEC
ncbi:MAG: 3-phosphoshikimate 1-carboxyvinyltransferase, partial [Bacteroidota bacterium]